ncbi:MAG: hypothetical protein NXH75_01765 [Halobacteriovoraceae bacterium]|nr:hypothetical protein [Halobacteriovoraceae bacterium]
MKRLLTATLLSFLTMYSSLAGVIVELHLVDHHNHHDHHHIHDDHHQENHHENYKEESLIEHVIFHANHDKESNHAHEKQPEYVLSSQKDYQNLFLGPQLLFSPTSINTNYLNNPTQDFNKVSYSKSLAYSPPPDRFRNLPLLN